MKKFKYILGTALGFSLPTLAFADATDFKGLVGVWRGYLDTLIPLLVGVAVVAFIYGIVRYIYSGGDEESRKEGIKFITYGLVGLAVITTLWGLVRVAASLFGIQDIGLPRLTP